MRISRHVAACLLLTLPASAVLTVDTARAQGTDMERLQQCDRDLCGIIRAPSQKGRALQCDLGATFYKEDIDKAAKSKKLTWPLGDARCTMKLDVERAILASAMKEKTYTLKVPKQLATCEVEYNDKRYPATLSVAPEIEFRDGSATSVSLGVQDIEANALVKGLIWSLFKLEATLGLFRQDLVKGVNAYIEQHCRIGVTKRQAERSAPQR